MAAMESVRHSQVWIWTWAWLLAMLLVLIVLTRVAGAGGAELQPKPGLVCIVSPSQGTFVAGAYRGGEPHVGVGSEIQTGVIVGNVEVRGKLQPVCSMVNGTVIQTLAVDEAIVVARQPLFIVRIEVETPA